MLDMVVIGAGPAGLTAGMYAARAGLDVVVIEKQYAGGQIVLTHLMENYPGFPDGIQGAEFGERLRAQAERFGARLVMEEVTGLELAGETKRVVTEGEVYETRTVVLAMGASPRRLGLPGEEEFTGAGISYCATCDGAFFKGREVCVIGGGDTAFEDALYLSRLAKKVTLVHRRKDFRARGVAVARAEAADNIFFEKGMLPAAILSEGIEFRGLVLEDRVTGEKKELIVDGCFVAVGYEPDTALVQGMLTLEGGYVTAGEDTRTDVPGVFVAGDVRKKHLRQVVTAAADGATAAAMAAAYIESHAR